MDLPATRAIIVATAMVCVMMIALGVVAAAHYSEPKFIALVALNALGTGMICARAVMSFRKQKAEVKAQSAKDSPASRRLAGPGVIFRPR